MKILGQILVGFAVLLCTSCEKEPVNDAVQLSWDYGKNEYNMEVDGAERNFIIHVPEKYSDETQVPLVFMLHGSTGTGTKFYNISRWVEKADAEGFIAVFPTALAYKIKDTNRTSTKWSSDGLPEQLEEGTVVKDDIPFIEGLVNLCLSTFKIDESRLYISGFSNGGGFVKTQIITRLGHQFAAASSSGGIGHREPFSVVGDRLTPLFTIAGNKDENIIENLNEGEQIPLKGEEIMTVDFLQNQITNTLNGLQLSSVFIEEPVPPSYNKLTFNEDLSGQGNEYILMIVDGLAHNYPNEINNPNKVVAVDFLWEWFNKWQLN